MNRHSMRTKINRVLCSLKSFQIIIAVALLVIVTGVIGIYILYSANKKVEETLSPTKKTAQNDDQIAVKVKQEPQTENMVEQYFVVVRLGDMASCPKDEKISTLSEDAYGIIALKKTSGIDEKEHDFYEGLIIPSTINGIQISFVCANIFNSIYNVIPENIKMIRKNAFFYSKFDEITIPATVETIEADSFVSCKVNTLTFEKGITEINDGAFRIWSKRRVFG